MAVRIKTPAGDRIIPDWATCYCVTRHTPTYTHPYPFSLPNGRELWLCPNTFHQATTLRAIYENLNGPPRDSRTYSSFVRQLVKMSWQQTLSQVAVEQKKAETEEAAAREARELFERAKQVVIDARGQ